MSSAKRGAVGVLIALAGVVVIAFFANTFASATINHGQVVPESPRRNVPVVLDGQVNAHAQIGDRIFVGGDFQQVERADGTVITQPYLFAYDINTGVLDENFRPVLNNLVLDLQTNPAEDAVYVSGRFWSWDSAFPNRIAKMSPDGTLDTTFQAGAEAMVRSIAVTDDAVYMAGNFTTVNGQPRVGLAAVDVDTGAVDAGFVMNVNNTTVTSQYGRSIVASSDGNTVFALHFGTQINGATRESVAKINVSGPTATLANWRIDMSGQAGNRLCIRDMRDIAISPDNSFVVIGGQGADNPPNCDSILRYETSGTGVIPFTWTARMYSSVFSLAVSDVAVYAGGHFCAAPLNGAPVGGSTHDPAETGTANQCNVNDPNDPVNPSVQFPGSAVFRNQMAALSPTNGKAMPWDPGSNNSVGVFDITLIDRGLLAGHDNNRFGDDILTGRSGFFDFGVPADTTAPTVTVTSPGNGAVLTSITSITGTAQDNRIVSNVTAQVKNITTGQWLQANGTTMAATSANAPVTVTSTGLGTADWSITPGTTLPPGDYEVRVFGTDQAGQTTQPTVISPFTIAGNTACSVTLNANNEPVISWSGFDGVDDTQIRRNGSWISTEAPNSGTYTDNDVVAGNSYSYVVRYRPNGVVTDIACTPTSVTIPTGGGAVCSDPAAITVDIAAGQSPTNGDDVILGTAGADIINGLAGNDVICGLGGNDTLNGGGGADTIFGGGGADTIGGQGGNDMLYGEGGADRLNGGVGDDLLSGGDGADDLRGQGNDDIMNGDAGVDQFFGGSGNDTINTGAGGNLGTAQVVRGGGNNDVITGSSTADDLEGGSGLDELYGEGGNDRLRGGNATDDLYGGTGNDMLEGGAQRDFLYGGGGNDTLNGGTGNDDLFGEAGADTLNGQGNTDLCNGGSGADSATVACETQIDIP